MNNTEQKLLKGFLSKTLNMDEEAMSSLFNEDGELTSIETALKADAERIAKHKKENEAQMNRGLKEGAEKIEKAIRKRYGIESENIGIDLVEELVQAQVAAVSEKAGDVDIEKHPEFIKQKSAYEKQLRDKDKEKEEAIQEIEEKFQRTATITKVKELALLELESKNPILPQDPKKAKAWKETYLKEIEAGNYLIDDVGNITVLDKDGKALTNEHGHNIDFKDFTVNIADKYFEFPAAQQQRSSTNLNNNQDGNKPLVVKDQDDYVRQMREAKTPQERAELTKVWTNSKK